MARIFDIRDPLSITKCKCQGSIQALLERASDAWGQACPEEALRVCYAADRHASECDDRAGTALAQLYLAYGQAQRCNLEEGIKLAERAAVNFKLLGDRHNNVVAHLLLGRLKRALYNFEDARLDYQEALALCQKLESEAKETARSDTAQLYAQITEQARQVLENIETDRHQWLEVIKDFHIGACDLAQIEDEESTRLSMDLRRKRVAEGQIDVSYREGRFCAHFLNEGDGDSIVLQFPDNSLAVVDCCNSVKTHRYLQALGRQLELGKPQLVFVAVTRAHADHDNIRPLIDKLGGSDFVEEVWLSKG